MAIEKFFKKTSSIFHFVTPNPVHLLSCNIETQQHLSSGYPRILPSPVTAVSHKTRERGNEFQLF